jgi:hypothetical protein
MKLTKAQRLFVEVGKAQASMEYYKWCENQSLFDDEDDDGVILVTENRNIAKYRKLRKRLIREALRAYELEIGDAFTAGGEMVKRIHGLSDEFMLVDGDIIF